VGIGRRPEFRGTAAKNLAFRFHLGMYFQPDYRFKIHVQYPIFNKTTFTTPWGSIYLFFPIAVCLLCSRRLTVRAPQGVPEKNLLFKLQIFGYPEERRLPGGLNGMGAFSFDSFSLSAVADI